MGRDGPYARNFMCRSLLPVIVVRPRRMKFQASWAGSMPALATSIMMAHSIRLRNKSQP